MKIVCITPIKHIEGVFNMLSKNFDVVYKPEIAKDDLNSLLREDAQIQGIYTNPNKQSFVINESVLKDTAIRVICTASTGTNHIDINFCDSNNIDVISLTKDMQTIEKITSTAEHAFSLMMSMIRNIPSSFESVKRKEWDYEKYIGRQVDNLAIGILGYGRLGKMMARFCDAFNMEIFVCDPYVKVENFKQVGFNEMMEKSDIISLHVHLNDETNHMINSNSLDLCRRSPYIINTSRGAVANEYDIIRALREKKISGYATDVLENELGDIEKSPLIEKANQFNIVITPHIGGMTREGQKIAYTRVAQVLIDSYGKR
jgi:D-3-phosphoglycerate dehydrogenase